MSWRMKLAFLIADKELYAWRSKHARIVGKMSTSMAERQISKVLQAEALRHRDLGLDASAEYLEGLVNTLYNESVFDSKPKS